MSKVTSFTINRKNWLRGEGGQTSCLLRPVDCKMCCLGFYLSACGIDNEKLLGIASPAYVNAPLPEETAWLLENGMRENSINCSRLMTINDETDALDPQHLREKAIAAKFAEQGITVVFEG